VKVLFTTGYAANVLPRDFAARGARLLSKPYKPQRLLAQVRELLHGATLEEERLEEERLEEQPLEEVAVEQSALEEKPL